MSNSHVCFVSESEATYALLMGLSSGRMGGAELQQSLIANELVKLGYKVTFVVPDLGQAESVIAHNGVRLLRGRSLDRRAGHGLPKLLSVLRKANADIYYQRTSAAITGVVACFCGFRKKPFVFSVGSDMDVSGEIGLFISPRMKWLYRYGLRNATSVVVQTEHQKVLLRENVGRVGVVIRSTFSPPANGVYDRTTKYVLWAGSFRALKRPDMFVELAKRLPQYRFVMMGGPGQGEEHVYTEIRTVAEGVPNLKMTGPVAYADTDKYFGESAVFVNTSISEGFPNTYLQAWCRGVPVIATVDSDCLIAKHGLGQSCNDLDDLAKAVCLFCEDDGLRSRAGTRAVDYVYSEHLPEAVASRYDELFSSLVSKSEIRR